MGVPGPTAYDVAVFYDRAYYRDLARRYALRSRFARQRIENVRSLLPPLAGRRVLDVGCGMGTFVFEATRSGARAVGLDLAPAALGVALEVAASEGVAGAVFVRGDAARLPFGAGTIDVVLAADVTEHLDDATLAAVIGEARRVLRPGGELVLYTPSPTHLLERLRARSLLLKPDPSHIGLRDAGVLAEAVRAGGLDVARIVYLPSHLPVLKLIERGLARWLPLLRRRIGLVAVKQGKP